MSPNEKVNCDRCKISVPFKDTESLRFASKVKATTLRLCKPCFLSARKTFTEWLKNE